MKIKEIGPRDSKRKTKKYENETNEEEENDNNNNNELQEEQNEEEEEEEEPINSNEDINYLRKHNLIINPIAGAISNAIINDNNYNSEINININNQNNIKSQNNKKKYNFVKKEIIPIPQLVQVKESRVYTSPEQQKESPKFNVIESNQQIYNNENNIFQSDVYGNEETGISMGNNIIYDNNIQVLKKGSYNESQNQKSSIAYEVTGSDFDNPLLYSDDMGNMNYLEKKYAIYQDQINLYNNGNY